MPPAIGKIYPRQGPRRFRCGGFPRPAALRRAWLPGSGTLGLRGVRWRTGPFFLAVFLGLSPACLKGAETSKVRVDEKAQSVPRPGFAGLAALAARTETAASLPGAGSAGSSVPEPGAAVPGVPGSPEVPVSTGLPEAFQTVLPAAADSGRPRELFLHGARAFKGMRFREASGYFEACLGFPSGWQDYALYYLLKSRWEAGDVRGTLSLCGEFRQSFPESLLLNRVRILEAQGCQRDPSQWGAALQAYEGLLREQDRADLRFRYSKLLEELGRLPEAYESYGRIRRNWPGASISRQARTRMREIEKESPQLAARNRELRPLLQEADLCLREGAYGEALSHYQELLARQPDPPLVRRVLRGRTLAQLKTGKLDPARGTLQRLMEGYPGTREDLEISLAVGREFWRKNRNQEAAPLLERLVDRFTDTGEAGQASYILGRIGEEAGDRGAAIEQYKRTRFLYPGTEWEQEAAWREAWCHYLRRDYASCAALLWECEQKGIWVGELLPRARYWRARCLERSGRPAQARDLYELTAGRHRDSFYGQAAEKRLKGLPLLPDFSPRVLGTPVRAGGGYGESVLSRFVDPALPLLLEAGLSKDAAERLQWLQGRGLEPKINPDDWMAAYALAGAYAKSIGMARSNGRLSRLLETSGPGPDPDKLALLRLIYPLPYWDTIRGESARKGLDPFLVAGLIHQESLFMSDALSPAGAIGLMQVMPATGSQVASKIGMAGFRASSLQDPVVNIRIGTAYLASLKERYGSQWHKVLANYNAGSGPVARWTSAMPEAEVDEYVEGISYRETRVYVKKVLFNAAVYRRIYAEAGPSEDAS